jgi:hypothetical protein
MLCDFVTFIIYIPLILHILRTDHRTNITRTSHFSAFQLECFSFVRAIFSPSLLISKMQLLLLRSSISISQPGFTQNISSIRAVCVDVAMRLLSAAAAAAAAAAAL